MTAQFSHNGKTKEIALAPSSNACFTKGCALSNRFFTLNKARVPPGRKTTVSSKQTGETYQLGGRFLHFLALLLSVQKHFCFIFSSSEVELKTSQTQALILSFKIYTVLHRDHLFSFYYTRYFHYADFVGLSNSSSSCS